METVLYIAASIALLALAGLFVYLMAFIKGSKKILDRGSIAVDQLVTEISGLRASLNGTIKNIEGITARAEGTLDRVNNQLDSLDGIVESVSRISEDAVEVVGAAKGVVVSVIDFEQSLQRKVTAPVEEAMSIFTALARGIRTFREKISGNNNGYSRE